MIQMELKIIPIEFENQITLKQFKNQIAFSWKITRYILLGEDQTYQMII